MFTCCKAFSKWKKSLNVAVSATKVKFLLLPLVSLNCSMFGCIFLLLWHFLLRSWAAQNPPLSLDATFLSIPSPVMPSCPLNCPHKHLCQCMYACVILLKYPYLNMSSMCGCLGMCSRIIYLWIHSFNVTVIYSIILKKIYLSVRCFILLSDLGFGWG